MPLRLRTLRSRLVALFALVALAPLLVVGVADVTRLRMATERLVLAQTAEVARRTAALIEDRFALVASDQRLLAENTETQRILRAVNDGAGRDDPSLHAAFAYLDSLIVRLRPTYHAIALLDRAGRPALQAGSLGGRFGGAPLEHPVVDGETGRPLGKLLLVPRVDALVPEGAIGTAFGRTGYVAVIDRAAALVVAHTAREWRARAAADLLPGRWRLEFRDAGAPRDVRFGEGDSARVATVLPLGALPWTVVASTAVAELAGPFDATRRENTVFLAVLALAAAAVFVPLVGRATGSLEALTQAARATGRGDFDPPLPAPGHDEVGVLTTTFAEMTRRLRATISEIETSRQMAVLGEFAAHLAHEIRNPLTSLRFELQGLLRTARTGPVATDAGDAVERCLHEVQRLDRVAGGVLQLGRPRALKLDRVDLAAVAARAVDALARELERRGITVERDLAPAVVMGEAALLEGAVINLVRNAADAQPHGGRILLRVRVHAAGADLTVTDDGSGIPAAAAEQLFRPFYSTKADGTGLGLPMALRVAQEHAGGLTAGAAPPPWRGAAFTLTLPPAPVAIEAHEEVPT